MTERAPRILFLDIETFPILAHVWTVYEANAVSVERNTMICCFSAKWQGGKQVTKALPDFPRYKAGAWDDSRIAKALWELMNEADVIVAQNGDRFDVKKINARLIKHGLTPPAPYKTVDTLKIARNVFGFDSNRLNDLCSFLGIGEKFHTGGFGLWQGCMAGNEKAWRTMRKYNAQDVRLPESLYDRFLPWTKNHPNVGLHHKGDVCPRCGSRELIWRGLAFNKTTAYRRFRCGACGGWGRTGENVQKDKPLVSG